MNQAATGGIVRFTGLSRDHGDRGTGRRRVRQSFADRSLTQAEAAKLLGLNQPKVSALTNYKLSGFSVERLMNLLTALDRDIEIVIRKPSRPRGGRISVKAA